MSGNKSEVVSVLIPELPPPPAPLERESEPGTSKRDSRSRQLKTAEEPDDGFVSPSAEKSQTKVEPEKEKEKAPLPPPLPEPPKEKETAVTPLSEPAKVEQKTNTASNAPPALPAAPNTAAPPSNQPPTSAPSSTITLNLPNENIDEALCEYAIYVLRNSRSPRVENSPHNQQQYDQLRRTTEMANICVCPLQAARGWALLSLAGEGSTRNELEQLVGKILGHRVRGEELHQALDCLHSQLQGIPNAVRLFYEHQSIVPLVASLQDFMDNYYLGANAPHCSPSTLRLLSFAVDDDGYATAAKINYDIAFATSNSIRYVVRSENSPNVKAQSVLVSAMDCTFFWKPSGDVAEKPFCFYESTARTPETRSFMNYFHCTGGTYRVQSTSQYNLIELESQDPLFTLYLYQPIGTGISACLKKSEDFANIAKLALKMPAARPVNIIIPKFAVATPLRLKESSHSKKFKYNAWRVYDWEKAKLTAPLYKNNPKYYPYTLPLWNHYHKAKFVLRADSKVNPTASADLQPPQVPSLAFGIDLHTMELTEHRKRMRAGAEEEEPLPVEYRKSPVESWRVPVESRRLPAGADMRTGGSQERTRSISTMLRSLLSFNSDRNAKMHIVKPMKRPDKIEKAERDKDEELFVPYREEDCENPPGYNLRVREGVHPDAKADFVIDTPFCFVVMRKLPNNTSMIHCMGIFTNIDHTFPLDERNKDQEANRVSRSTPNTSEPLSRIP